MAKILLIGQVAILSSIQVSAAENRASLLPTPLGEYHDPAGAGLWEVLAHRAEVDPFNVVARR
jgi:hypothetical protein